MQVTRLQVSVRAENGARGDQAWIECGDLSMRERALAASRFILGGLAVGSVLVFVPLIHIVGVFVALTGLGLGLQRLNRRHVIAKAGGVCPSCGHEASFFSGIGRPKFSLPFPASCGTCGIILNLLP